MPDKKPLTDEERQAYIDNLPDEAVNLNAQEKFDRAIERAAKPSQSEPETPAAGDSYNDTQTRSDTAANTSD